MQRFLNTGGDWLMPVVPVIFGFIFMMLAAGASAEQVNVVLNAGTLVVTILAARDVRGPDHGLLA